MGKPCLPSRGPPPLILVLQLTLQRLRERPTPSHPAGRPEGAAYPQTATTSSNPVRTRKPSASRV